MPWGHVSLIRLLNIPWNKCIHEWLLLTDYCKLSYYRSLLNRSVTQNHLSLRRFVTQLPHTCNSPLSYRRSISLTPRGGGGGPSISLEMSTNPCFLLPSEQGSERGNDALALCCTRRRLRNETRTFSNITSLACVVCARDGRLCVCNTMDFANERR